MTDDQFDALLSEAQRTNDLLAQIATLLRGSEQPISMEPVEMAPGQSPADKRPGGTLPWSQTATLGQ